MFAILRLSYHVWRQKCNYFCVENFNEDNVAWKRAWDSSELVFISDFSNNRSWSKFNIDWSLSISTRKMIVDINI